MYSLVWHKYLHGVPKISILLYFFLCVCLPSFISGITKVRSSTFNSWGFEVFVSLMKTSNSPGVHTKPRKVDPEDCPGTLHQQKLHLVDASASEKASHRNGLQVFLRLGKRMVRISSLSDVPCANAQIQQKFLSKNESLQSRWFGTPCRALPGLTGPFFGTSCPSQWYVKCIVPCAKSCIYIFHWILLHFSPAVVSNECIWADTVATLKTSLSICDIFKSMAVMLLYVLEAQINVRKKTKQKTKLQLQKAQRRSEYLPSVWNAANLRAGQAGPAAHEYS